MDPFLAEIIMFAGNFNPRGWALCDGQLLPIAQNQALFSLLGTIYGGDGRTTFALPDLRGRVAMHPGNGPGLTPRRLGQKGGVETHTLLTAEMPSHTHTVVETTPANVNIKVADEDGVIAAAFKGVLGKRAIEDSTGQAVEVYVNKNSASFTEGNTLGGVDITQPVFTAANTGGNQSFYLMQPYTCINYIIAMQGVFPSRS